MWRIYLQRISATRQENNLTLIYCFISFCTFRHYNIYFFHILINIETDRDSIKWTFYKSQKSFLTFPGIFTVKGSPLSWRISSENSETRCLELGSNCVAIEMMTNNTVDTLIDYLDLDSFKPSKYKVTRIKVQNIDKETKILSKSSWDLSKVDFCCPKHQKVQPDIYQGANSIRRIPCNVSIEFFQNDFVRKLKLIFYVKNCQ